MSALLRYLTRQKLEWLLSDEGLFVGSAQVQLDDSEGKYDSRISSKLLNGEGNPEFDKEALDYLDNFSLKKMSYDIEENFISSWFKGNKESLTMWNEYAKNGIIIVSSIDQLMRHLPQPLEQATSFYHVIYDDEAKASAINDPLQYKNKKYSYENEFRIVFNLSIYSMLTGYEKETHNQIFIGKTRSYESSEITRCINNVKNMNTLDVISKKENGHILKYNLNNIITAVIVSPYCSEDEFLKITSLCKKNGLTVTVYKSELVNSIPK